MLLDRFRQKTMDVALGAAGRLFADTIRGTPPSEPVEVVWPGTYSWPMFAARVDSLRVGFTSLTTVTPGPGPFTLNDVISVQFRHRGRSYLIGIDVGDLSHIPPRKPRQVLPRFQNAIRQGRLPLVQRRPRRLRPLRQPHLRRSRPHPPAARRAQLPLRGAWPFRHRSRPRSPPPRPSTP